MKIVMTIMTSSGKCASLTNATPCEQVSMCLSAYGDAINRLEKTSGRKFNKCNTMRTSFYVFVSLW